MSPTAMPTVRRMKSGLRGAHVLAAFLAFFGMIFAVNGAMIYSALKTHTGLVANEPYRKGLHYNERIAASERQALLDWSDAVSLRRDGMVAVRVTASGGRPVPSLSMRAVVGRPSTNSADRAIELKEAMPGLYEGSLGSLEPGNWLVALEARADRAADEPVYRARRRLWLAP